MKARITKAYWKPLDHDLSEFRRRMNSSQPCGLWITLETPDRILNGKKAVCRRT